MWPACRAADHYSASEQLESGWSVNSPPSLSPVWTVGSCGNRTTARDDENYSRVLRWPPPKKEAQIMQLQSVWGIWWFEVEFRDLWNVLLVLSNQEKCLNWTKFGSDVFGGERCFFFLFILCGFLNCMSVYVGAVAKISTHFMEDVYQEHREGASCLQWSL